MAMHLSTTDARSTDEFIKGLWRENPVFVQALGMCPVLAVSIRRATRWPWAWPRSLC